jgi:hypothetical protein
MGKYQKPSNPECCTPSSVPFRIRMDLFVQKQPILSTCTQTENHGHIKPDTGIAKTEYKWKTTDTLNMWLARNCCARKHTGMYYTRLQTSLANLFLHLHSRQNAFLLCSNMYMKIIKNCNDSLYHYSLGINLIY